MRKILSVLATAVLVLQSMGTSLVYAQAVTETEGGEPTSAMDIVADVFAPESNDDGDNDESPVIEEVAVEETVAEPEVAEEEATAEEVSEPSEETTPEVEENAEATEPEEVSEPSEETTPEVEPVDEPEAPVEEVAVEETVAEPEVVEEEVTEEPEEVSYGKFFVYKSVSILHKNRKNVKFYATFFGYDFFMKFLPKSLDFMS